MKMEVITIQHEAFLKLMERLESLERCIAATAEEKFRNVWLSGDETARLLCVSYRTLQSYRDRGMLAFSQIGNKIHYQLEDVNQFLLDHRNEPF